MSNVERLDLPPFILNSCAALAFVEGKYNSPSDNITEVSADDYLGIYVSVADPGIALITTSRDGRLVAFHRCGDADASALFALIDGLLNYEIPIEQWIVYPVRPPELEVLDALGLREAFQKQLQQLAEVLRLARLFTRPNRTLKPMFLVHKQSAAELLENGAAYREIVRVVLGSEKTDRYFKNIERLKLQRRTTGNGSDSSHQ